MDLDDKLRSIGAATDEFDDPASLFAQLHEAMGEEATVIDRYELEARATGVLISEIGPEQRLWLGREVLSVRGFEVVGPPRALKVEVAPYDPDWPAQFEGWRQRLAEALGGAATTIEHMGSTAVPGLAAKPIIDVLVTVPDVDDEASYVPQLESLGVPLRSRDRGHRYFRPPTEPRAFQVHVANAGSEWRRTHLLFRDYLRAHSDVAAAYAELKDHVAAEHPYDRIAYTDLKGSFIRRALADAAAWAEATGWDP